MVPMSLFLQSLIEPWSIYLGFFDKNVQNLLFRVKVKTDLYTIMYISKKMNEKVFVPFKVPP